MSDKAIYQAIADELKTNNVDPALWTQAIAQAAGEQDKIQATYIRLRFADLKQAASRQKTPAPSLNSAGTDLTVQDSRLIPLRAELKKMLAAQGKTSLYAVLGLQPDASSSLIAAAAADMESSGQVGSVISDAEFRYARETLSDPVAREQYDRKLLASLAYGGGAQVQTYSYEPADSSSWWTSSKATFPVVVMAIALAGYLGLGFFKERGHHEIQKATVDVQKDAVGVQRDAVQSAADIERQRVQSENEMRQRQMDMAAEAQRRQMDYQLQAQQAQREAQREAQERQRQAEKDRQKMQQEQQDNLKAQRERQYWACMNQQLDMRGVSTYDASARCAMYH